MTNPERIVRTTTPPNVRERTAAYILRAAEVARNGAERAADRLQAAETPVRKLADAARQLNAFSHRYVGRMLDQSVTTVYGFMSDGAERLRRAAHADDVRSLFREQLQRLPKSRDRVVKHARATWEILTEAGSELQTLASMTYAELTTKTTKTAKTAKRTKRRARRAPRRAA